MSLITNPKNIVILWDVFSEEYYGGHDLTFLNNKQDIENATHGRFGARPLKSIMCVWMPPNAQQSAIPPNLDISQQVYSHPKDRAFWAGYSFDDQRFGLQEFVQGAYYETPATAVDGSRIYYRSPISHPGLQIQWNPMSKLLDDRIECGGHWEGLSEVGMGRFRCGDLPTGDHVW